MLRKRLEPLTFFYEGVFMVTILPCTAPPPAIAARPSRRKPGSWLATPEPCRRPHMHPWPARRRIGCKERGVSALARGRDPLAPGQAGGSDREAYGKVNLSRKGWKTYSYWMDSWREGGKTRNVHLGVPGK